MRPTAFSAESPSGALTDCGDTAAVLAFSDRQKLRLQDFDKAGGGDRQVAACPRRQNKSTACEIAVRQSKRDQFPALHFGPRPNLELKADCPTFSGKCFQRTNRTGLERNVKRYLGCVKHGIDGLPAKKRFIAYGDRIILKVRKRETAPARKRMIGTHHDA